MARRKLIWHVGPADPGTAFLGDALRERGDDLAALGVALPAGTWPEVEEQVWAHRGLSLLSTPGISRAKKEQVELRLAGFRDVELHLVWLVRDLPTQVYAGWQEGIQQGSTTGLDKYAARVLDPQRSHWQAEEFWTGRDLAALLKKWARASVPDRVHVVGGTDEGALWKAFLDIAGLPDVPCVAERIAPPFLASLDRERLLEVTEGWTKQIADAGFDLRGSLTEVPAQGVVPSKGQQFDTLVEMLAETTAQVGTLRRQVVELRRENDRLDRKRRKHKRRARELAARLED